MAKVNLENYQPEEVTLNEVEVDEIIAALESHPYLLAVEDMDELSMETISQENLLKEFGKGMMADLKDSIDDLLSGSESINKKYVDRLSELESRAADLEGKEKRPIGSLAGMIYNEFKGEFQTDLSKLLKSDINFLEDLKSFIQELDRANDDNIKTFSRVLKAEDTKEYNEILSKKVYPDLISSEEVLDKFRLTEDTLYNTRVESKGKFIKLEYSNGSYTLKEKLRANMKPYMTGSDVAGILKQVQVLGKLTEEIISLMKDLEEKHHPRTGKVPKDLISIEKTMIDRIGIKDYVDGLGFFIKINQKLFKTLDKFPRKVVARNIKVLKTFTSFGEKLTSIKLNRK